MENTIVVYFSHTGQNYFSGGYKDLKVGNAHKIADKVSAFLNCQEFEIKTKKAYPFGYKDCCDQALEEQKKNYLPELASKLESPENYQNFVLVYPCWWGTIPQAVVTFLTSYNFDNKNIYPICTHEGSGMGRSESHIKSLCKKANVSKGLAVQGSFADTCDSSLSSWLKGVGLK